MIKSIFITGTDTEVGKTVISCGLIRALQQRSPDCSVNGYKPIAAGAEQSGKDLVNEDGIALHAVSSSKLNYSEINPVVLEQAIAPHIAARLEKTPVDISLMTKGLEQLQAKSDFVVVEGAGGWHVPLDDHDITMSQWVVEQQLPVVLVVGIKLGCLNHALLTAEAITASGAKLIGWVANVLNNDPKISELNIQYLQDTFAAPCIATIPYKANLNAKSIANYFSLNALL